MSVKINMETKFRLFWGVKPRRLGNTYRRLEGTVILRIVGKNLASYMASRHRSC